MFVYDRHIIYRHHTIIFPHELTYLSLDSKYAEAIEAIQEASNPENVLHQLAINSTVHFYAPDERGRFSSYLRPKNANLLC